MCSCLHTDEHSVIFYKTPMRTSKGLAQSRTCQQPHWLHTKHWPCANLWAPAPVLEAHLLDMPSNYWADLEGIVSSLLQAAGLPMQYCQYHPQPHDRGTAIVQASEARVGRRILQEALDLLALPEEHRALQWSAAFKRLMLVVDSECLGPSTASIAEAAERQGLPYFRLQGNLVQIGEGAAQQRIWTAESDLTGAIGQDIAADKALTKRILANAGIPTPYGDKATSPAHAWELAQQIGTPVVVKPIDGNRARGVTLNLHLQVDIEAAWRLAKAEGTQVLVERFIPGTEHRLLVVGQQVVAATRGQTLDVIGDGQSSIAELIESQINQHPRCLIDMTLSAIDAANDAKVHLELQRQTLTIHSVPAIQQRVVLMRTGNLTEDCTDEVHPDIAQTAILAARTVGLDIAGIDFVMQDIQQPLQPQSGAIVEVNAGPSLLMHLRPVQGKARDVGAAISQHLFPLPTSGHIPVVGLLGSSTQTTRMAHALSTWFSANGYTSGWACNETMYLQNQRLPSPPMGFPSAGQRVLMHRAITAAVLTHSPEEVLQHGWSYSQCSLGIITAEAAACDTQSPHRLLAAQLRAVRSGGTVILPAQHASLETLALTCLGRVIWVGTDESTPLLQSHLRTGGTVAFIRNGQIVISQGSSETVFTRPELSSEWTAMEWLYIVTAGWSLQLSESTLYDSINNGLLQV